MDEPLARLVSVALAMLVIAAVTVVLRRRQTGAGKTSLPATGLEPGVYLFTSAACATCVAARDRLDQAIGAGGYIEITWDDQPEVFARLDIDAVPAVLVVGAQGSAELFGGQPDAVLEMLNP